MHYEDYKVGWICALPIERAAAVCMLDREHPPLPQKGADENIYALGEIGAHNVVIACLPLGLMGVTSAARVAEQMRSTFTGLRFALMVGIGGGVPSAENDIRLGDVVVSKPTDSSSGVIQYDYGKTLDNGRFRFIGSLNRPPDVLLNALSTLQAKYTYAESQIPVIVRDSFARFPRRQTSCAYPGPGADLLYKPDYGHQTAPDSPCKRCHRTALVNRPARTDNNAMVHYGIIASGNQVMRDGVTRERLRQDLNVLCFEMEASGLMDVFPCLIIRGISDYADSHKTFTWQPYAATTAAAYAKELLGVIPPRQVDETRELNLTVSDRTPVSAVSPRTPMAVQGSKSPLRDTAQLRQEIQNTQQEIQNLKKKRRRGKRKGKGSATPLTPAHSGLPVPQSPVQHISTPSRRSNIESAPASTLAETETGSKAIHDHTSGQASPLTPPTAQNTSYWEISSPIRTFEMSSRETQMFPNPFLPSLDQALRGESPGSTPSLSPPPQEGPQRQRSAFEKLPRLVIPRKEIPKNHDAALRSLFPPTPKPNPLRPKPLFADKKKGKSSGGPDQSSEQAVLNRVSQSQTGPKPFDALAQQHHLAGSLPISPPRSSEEPPPQLSILKGDAGPSSNADIECLHPQPRTPRKTVSFNLEPTIDSSFQIFLPSPPATPTSSSPSNHSLYTISPRLRPQVDALPSEASSQAITDSAIDIVAPAPRIEEDFVGISAAEELSVVSSMGRSSASQQLHEPGTGVSPGEASISYATHVGAIASASFEGHPARADSGSSLESGLEVVLASHTTQPAPSPQATWPSPPIVCPPIALTHDVHQQYQRYLERSILIAELPTYDSSCSEDWTRIHQETGHSVPVELPCSPHEPPDAPLADSPISPAAAQKIHFLEEKMKDLEKRMASTREAASITIRDKDRNRTFDLPWNVGRKWKATQKLIEQAYEAYPLLKPYIRQKRFQLLGPHDVLLTPDRWDKTVQPGWDIAIKVLVPDDHESPVTPRRSKWRIYWP